MITKRNIPLVLAVSIFLWVIYASAESVRFHMQAASTGSYAHPHDIVLSPDGKHLYVADNGNHRIAVLDSDTLEEVGSFGKGDVREPHDVVFDREGRLLVADTGNSRIAIFEISGTGGKLFTVMAESMPPVQPRTISSSTGMVRSSVRLRAFPLLTTWSLPLTAPCGWPTRAMIAWFTWTTP
jgi:hypothetical protein